MTWRKWLDTINPFIWIGGNVETDVQMWKRHERMLGVEGVPVGECGSRRDEDDLNTSMMRLRVDMFDAFSDRDPDAFDEKERRQIERFRRQLHRRGIETRGVVCDTPLAQLARHSRERQALEAVSQ